MDDILGMGRPANADVVRSIKGWVREAASLDDGATVMVSELHCHEPGCPDIETVIAVMRPNAENRQVKFPCALDGVYRAMVVAAFGV